MNDEELLQLSAVRNLINKATNGILPEGFNQWSLCDENGWTVAHSAGICGNLPKDFDQWGLTTKSGLSVAYVCAVWGSLPKGFHKDYPEHWNNVGSSYRVLKDVAISNGYKV